MIGINTTPWMHHSGSLNPGAEAGPNPSVLSNLLVQVSITGSFPAALAAHTPGTPYQITETWANLASGGPTFTHDTAARPYYHTANWTLDNSEEIPLPNGLPFWSSNASGGRGDNSLTTQQGFESSLSSRTPTGTEYSGLMVLYLQGSYGSTRSLFRDSTVTTNYSSVDCNEDAQVRIKDTTGGPYAINTSLSNSLMTTWAVYTWTHNSVDGSAQAINGARGTQTAQAELLIGNMGFDKFMPYTHYTTPFTEVLLWNAAHSLADLDSLAAQYATKYGITYTAP